MAETKSLISKTVFHRIGCQFLICASTCSLLGAQLLLPQRDVHGHVRGVLRDGQIVYYVSSRGVFYEYYGAGESRSLGERDGEGGSARAFNCVSLVGGEIWAGAEDGLFKVDGPAYRRVELEPLYSLGLHDKLEVFFIEQQANGVVWLGTSHGLFFYEFGTQYVIREHLRERPAYGDLREHPYSLGDEESVRRFIGDVSSDPSFWATAGSQAYTSRVGDTLPLSRLVLEEFQDEAILSLVSSECGGVLATDNNGVYSVSEENGASLIYRSLGPVITRLEEVPGPRSSCYALIIAGNKRRGALYHLHDGSLSKASEDVILDMAYIGRPHSDDLLGDLWLAIGNEIHTARRGGSPFSLFSASQLKDVYLIVPVESGQLLLGRESAVFYRKGGVLTGELVAKKRVSSKDPSGLPFNFSESLPLGDAVWLFGESGVSRFYPDVSIEVDLIVEESKSAAGDSEPGDWVVRISSVSYSSEHASSLAGDADFRARIFMAASAEERVTFDSYLPVDEVELKLEGREGEIFVGVVDSYGNVGFSQHRLEPADSKNRMQEAGTKNPPDGKSDSAFKWATRFLLSGFVAASLLVPAGRLVYLLVYTKILFRSARYSGDLAKRMRAYLHLLERTTSRYDFGLFLRPGIRKRSSLLREIVCASAAVRGPGEAGDFGGILEKLAGSERFQVIVRRDVSKNAAEIYRAALVENRGWLGEATPVKISLGSFVENPTGIAALAAKALSSVLPDVNEDLGLDLLATHYFIFVVSAENRTQELVARSFFEGSTNGSRMIVVRRG